jgi:sugar/nucleoside kinase (ribokinase family)
MSKKLIISGVGSGLVDNLYNEISFSSDNFLPFLSKAKGDGGLIPGQLVLKRDFERFSNKRKLSGLENIISNRPPDKINIGGPGIVSMIHSAQLSDNNKSEFHFYGVRGNDENGDFIISRLKKTPLLANNYKIVNDKTPFTTVLSDPEYNDRNGERIFVNTIGAAWKYSSDELDAKFFSSDIVVFGGTALMPLIQDSLTESLEKAKSNGCITIVNTVYDYISEKESPTKKWPLGKSDDSYKYIDLLIMNHEEAIRLSGKLGINKAMQFFHDTGTGAVIITNGAENVKLFSNGSLFQAMNNTEMPISKTVSDELKKGNYFGDTTGCGDNFVGGIIASLVSQIQNSTEPYDLAEACIWGIISGGTTCFYIGGMYEEKFPGEKIKMIQPYYKRYKKQIKEREF